MGISDWASIATCAGVRDAPVVLPVIANLFFISKGLTFTASAFSTLLLHQIQIMIGFI